MTTAIEITEELRSTLVRVGNYTHPLFSDLEVAKNSGMPTEKFSVVPPDEPVITKALMF